MALDISSLSKSVSSLEKALQAAETMRDADESVRETLQAGIIQNFEFVYELCIKMLRRRMELDAASPVETDFAGFKDLLRTAGEKGLIADVEAWFEYRKARNKSSHTYDEDAAEEVLRIIPAFLTEARFVRDKLIERDHE